MARPVASAFSMKKDYGRAIADIRQVLKREPRHFGALAGLGLILQDIGDDKQALEVYRRALEVYPRMKARRFDLMSVPRAFLATLIIAFITAPAFAQDPQAAHPGYAGAGACKTCHAQIFDAWQRTKHARAIDKLTPSERQGDA